MQRSLKPQLMGLGRFFVEIVRFREMPSGTIEWAATIAGRFNFERLLNRNSLHSGSPWVMG